MKYDWDTINEMTHYVRVNPNHVAVQWDGKVDTLRKIHALEKNLLIGIKGGGRILIKKGDTIPDSLTPTYIILNESSGVGQHSLSKEVEIGQYVVAIVSEGTHTEVIGRAYVVNADVFEQNYKVKI